MSYARKGEDSDVYVVGTGYGIECVNCFLKPRYKIKTKPIDLHLSTVCQTPDHMLAHLIKHKSKGHKVPERAIKRLRLEADQKYKNWHKPPKSYRKFARDNLNPNEAFKR
jgi:hypothetical protein